MTGKQISHYIIEAELGRGGMGVVYRAMDTKLDRIIALKMLPSSALSNEDDRTRFYREAKAAAQLHHAHIASIFEIDEAVVIGSAEDSARPFIAMEFIDGETLESRIKKGPLSIDEAVRIASEIAEALREAHEKNIVHRDIKSANVMLDKNSRAKVLDFGLAKTAQSTMLTRMGSTIGTIAYMSPEQARGQDVDHRTDLWALGVVLYEMIAGKLPFGGDYEQAIVYSIMNEDPEPLSAIRTGVPLDIEWIIGKLCSKDAKSRYASAEDVLIDLRNVKDKPSGLSRVGSSPVGTPPSPIRGPGMALPDWRVLLGAAVLVVASFFIGRGLSSNPPPDNLPPMTMSLEFPEMESVAIPEFSPDGKSLLYSGADTLGSSTALYKRDLLSGKSERLVELAGLGISKYSEDGTKIAFSDGNYIGLISQDGENKATLKTISNSDAIWSSPSSIILDPQDGILREIYLDGRPEIVLATPDTTVEERFFWWPLALPGNRYIMYTVLWEEGSDNPSEIRVMDRESGTSETVIKGGEHAKYFKSGHLLYQLYDSEQIVAQAFDLNSRKTISPPVNLFFASMHSVSATGANILIYQPELQETDIRFSRLGSKDQLPFHLALTNDQTLRMSPSGKIAIVSKTSLNTLELVIRDPFSNYEQILYQGTVIESPIFSQDEKQLLFFTQENGAFGIKIVSLDGRGDEMFLTTGTTENVVIEDWSPDGNHILLSSTKRTDVTPSLSLLNVQSGLISPYLDQGVYMLNAEFSPDGKYVAYTFEDQGFNRVGVSPTDGSGRIISSQVAYLQSWTTDSSGLIVLDQKATSLQKQKLDLANGIRFLGAPQTLYESDRLLGGHMLSDGSIMIYESKQANPYNSFQVITNAASYLNSVAPPVQQ